MRRFTHGEISQADLEKEAEWPWLHVKPRAINYSPGTRAFSFEVFISDLPRDKEDKTGYQAESITDCSLIFQDLINEIYLGNMFGTDVVLTRPVNSEPFVEQYTHTLTGVTGIIELNLDYDWSACSIPASWNYNTPTNSPDDGWGALQFIDSLTQDGAFVSLVNDEETPGNSYYYGTDEEGVKGWYVLPTGLTCEDLPECATIISILEDIQALQTEVALKANTADLGATAFSNSYNDLDNLPTIPTATSELTNDGADGVNPFITAQDLPDTSGFVPYDGATQDLDLGTHELYVNKVFLLDEPNANYGSIHYTDGNFHIEDGDGHKLLVIEDGFMQIHLTDTIQSNLWTADLTETRDHYLPDQSGTIALTSDIPSIAGLVPDTRTLTINGTSYDLSADRSWTVSGSSSLAIGTTPITSGTVGRVLFEGTGNVLQQSANLFWDNTNNWLGIGGTPTTPLEVIGRVTLGKDAAVVTQSVSIIQAKDANTGVVIKPNGTGSILASIPDGTAVGGNARANYALDLQTIRLAADQIARGQYSAVLGGYSNTASGIYSVTGGRNNFISGNSATGFGYENSATNSGSSAMGWQNSVTGAFAVALGFQNNAQAQGTFAAGQSNTVNGQQSIAVGASNTAGGQGAFVANGGNIVSSVYGSAFGFGTNVSANTGLGFGGFASAYLEAQLSQASGRFAATGDAQNSVVTARREASLTTAATATLSLSGNGTSLLIIPNGNNRAWNVTIETIAVVTVITGTATGVSVGNCYRETKQLLFKRIGATSSIVGTVDTTAIKADSGMSTALLTVTAGGSQQMALTFTAPTFVGGGSVTCRVVSKVSLVECAY